MRPGEGVYANEFSIKARRPTRSEEITTELIKECYEIIARVVAVHGDHYLPLFERFHQELNARAIKQELLDTAHKVSSSRSSSNIKI